MTWPSSATRCRSKSGSPTWVQRPVEESVEALPSAEEHGDDVGSLPVDEPGPVRPPVRAPVGRRRHRAHDVDRGVRVEVTADRALVGDRDAPVPRLLSQADAECQRQRVPEQQGVLGVGGIHAIGADEVGRWAAPDREDRLTRGDRGSQEGRHGRARRGPPTGRPRPGAPAGAFRTAPHVRTGCSTKR